MKKISIVLSKDEKKLEKLEKDKKDKEKRHKQNKELDKIVANGGKDDVFDIDGDCFGNYDPGEKNTCDICGLKSECSIASKYKNSSVEVRKNLESG